MKPNGTIAVSTLLLVSVLGCLAEDRLAPTESRTAAAPGNDLRDAPRCDATFIVDEDMQGRWTMEYVQTNPGSGNGCAPFPAFTDTTDLCVGDSIFFVGGDDYECTMIGDASDFVVQVRYVFPFVDGCSIEGHTITKGVFNGDSYNATLTISQTLIGTECDPWDDVIGCVGQVLTITGQRVGPPDCAEPKRVVLHQWSIDAVTREIPDQREPQPRPRDVKDVRQYR